MHGLQIQTAPTDDPLSLAEVKNHLRVEDSDDDGKIARLLQAAIEFVQDATSRQLCEATYSLRLDVFPKGSKPILLPLYPVSEVGEIRHLDMAGNEQTLDADDYEVSTDREPCRIVPAWNTTWPATRLTVDAITIEFTAGYASPADVPARAKEAMLLLIGHWYEHREEVSEATLRQIPLGAQSLLKQLSYDAEFEDEL